MYISPMPRPVTLRHLLVREDNGIVALLIVVHIYMLQGTVLCLQHAPWNIQMGLPCFALFCLYHRIYFSTSFGEASQRQLFLAYSPGYLAGDAWSISINSTPAFPVWVEWHIFSTGGGFFLSQWTNQIWMYMAWTCWLVGHVTLNQVKW